MSSRTSRSSVARLVACLNMRAILGSGRARIFSDEERDADAEVIGEPRDETHGWVVRPALLQFPDVGLRHVNRVRYVLQELALADSELRDPRTQAHRCLQILLTTSDGYMHRALTTRRFYDLTILQDATRFAQNPMGGDSRDVRQDREPVSGVASTLPEERQDAFEEAGPADRRVHPPVRLHRPRADRPLEHDPRRPRPRRRSRAPAVGDGAVPADRDDDRSGETGLRHRGQQARPERRLGRGILSPRS